MENDPVPGRVMPSPYTLFGYMLALALIGVAVFATLGLRALSPVYLSFFGFYAAIFVSAWYGGYGAGLFAALLAALSVNAFFLPPFFSIMPMRDHLPRFAAYIISALIGAAVSAQQRRANMALREARDSLEERVRERTQELLDSRQRLDVQIAARDRAVEALRMILDVTQAASAAPTATAAAGACLEKICRLKELPFGQAWFRDEQQDRLMCAAKAVYGADVLPALRGASLATPLLKGQGLPGRVWKTGGAVWSRFDKTSVTESYVVRQRGPSGEYLAHGALVWEEQKSMPLSADTFPRLAGLPPGPGAAVAFPIFLGEKLLAVLEFFVCEFRPFDEAFLDAADKLGKLLGDVFERKHAEEAQRASEERWRRVFESSAVPMALADGHRRIVAANAACGRLLGYSPEEFLTLSALDFKYGDDRDVSERTLSELEQGLRREFQGEMCFRRKDGTPLWVNVSVSYVPATEVTPALFPAIIEDVTQRKTAELERRRLASIVEQARDFIGIADLEGTPLYLNEAGLKMVGFDDLDQARSRKGTHYLFPEDRPFMNQVVWRAVMEKGSWSGEFRLRHFKTGKAIPVLYHGFRIDDPETGQATNVGYSLRDITSRKQAEDALRASEERWRGVFETSLVGITTSDDSRYYTSANRAFQSMVGYSEAEIRAMQPIDLTHEDDRAESRELIDDLVAGRRHSYQIEKRYRRKDGEALWVDVYCSRVPGSESMPSFYQAIIIDITERKRAEAALRASVTRWRTVFATASVGIAMSDANRRILSANAALQRMLGYSEAELCALDWGDLTHEDDEALTQNWVADLAQGGQQSYQVEKRYRRKDGSYIWIHLNASYVPAIEAAPAFFVSIVVDIDERKRAEAALRRNEEQWRSIYEQAPIGIVIRSPTGHPVAMNPAFEKLVGYTLEEMRTRTFDEITHPDDRPLYHRLEENVAKGETVQFEKRYLRKDGRAVPVILTVSNFSGTESMPPGPLGIIQDITERKSAEEALRASEERWRRLFDTSSAGIALVSLEGRFVAVNPAFQRMLGYREAELQARTTVDISHEEDRAQAEVALGEFARQERQTYYVEKRCLRSDGRPVWVSVSTSYLSGRDGDQPLLVAIIVDISERKQVEAALRASEERWRRVFEHSPTGIATVGPDWRLTAANPACQRILGYSESELRELSAMDFSHEDDRDLTRDLLSQLVAGQQQAVRAQKRYRRKDGGVMWGDASLFHVPATEDTPAFVTAMVVDISEQKRAEESLARAQAELARVARVTTMGELAASIAHEINQPLAAIVASGGACQRWLSGTPPNLGRARDSLDRMISDANRASEVIRRIRSHARNTLPEPTELDINDVIEEVLAFVRSDLLTRQVSVRLKLMQGPPLVRGDRVQLQQVVLNLVMNGVEAMAGITDRGRVLLITSQLGDGGSPLVTVRDNGMGLAAGDAERIFDPFFTTKPEGMGMGLSISNSIIEAHGGRLWASPALPHGAAFHFSLPAPAESLPRKAPTLEGR